MSSIKQNSGFPMRLPDLRNLGVSLRILLLVNLIALIAAILQTSNLHDAVMALAELSAVIQPILLASLLLFYATYPRLRKLNYLWGSLAILLMEMTLTSVAYFLGVNFFGSEAVPPLPRAWLLTMVITAIVLYYFYLRHRALSPAITEARLQALQARIRPHFLFNCINAVISIVRSDPKRAETALIDMADLFRVLMADNRELVPLAKELALSRQYLALEKLRLDERLDIIWHVEAMPPDALIPPLILQPLLENAVYHGIESMPEGGEILIKIYTRHDEVHIILSNPYRNQTARHSGNKMALDNIRERLQLHFDVESQLMSKTSDGRYEVHIVIPYRSHNA